MGNSLEYNRGFTRLNMLWLKSFHIIAMVCWFAGIFYLPRLFVYHCAVDPNISKEHYERFCVMERRLFWGIMTPSALLTILLGASLLHYWNHQYWVHAKWFHYKMLLVALLIIFHYFCGRQVKRFKMQTNQHSARFYKLINELPVLILIGCVILVVVKP